MKNMKSLRPETFSDYAAYGIIGGFALVGAVEAWNDFVAFQVFVFVTLLIWLLWAFLHVINMMIQDDNEEVT